MKVILMGIEIGTCDSCERVDSENDNEMSIQYENFRPNEKFKHIPTAEYIAMNAVDGKYTIYREDDYPLQSGKILS